MKKLEDLADFGETEIFAVNDNASFYKYVKNTPFFFYLKITCFFSFAMFLLSFGIIASDYTTLCAYETKNPAQQKSFNLYCRNHFDLVVKIPDPSSALNVTRCFGNAERMNYFLKVSFIVLFEQTVAFYLLIVTTNYLIDMVIKSHFGKKNMADVFVPCRNEIKDFLIYTYTKCYQIVKELKSILLYRAAIEVACVIFVIFHMVQLDFLYEHEYFLSGIHIIRNHVTGSNSCSNIFPRFVTCLIGGFDGDKTAGYTLCHILINRVHQCGFFMFWMAFFFLIFYGLCQVATTLMSSLTHTCNLVELKKLQANIFANVGDEMKEVIKYEDEKPPIDKNE